MKTRFVIEVPKDSPKRRCKAIHVAMPETGVDSVVLRAYGKSFLVIVTGDGVDSIDLIKKLRKKVGKAYLLRQKVKEEEEEREPQAEESNEAQKKEEHKEPQAEESNEVQQKEEEREPEAEEIQWWPGEPSLDYDLPSNPNQGCSIL